MLFNSPGFAIFLPVMLAVYWSLRGRARRWALLLGSYFFYSWWDWRFTGLLVLHTLVDYGCALAIDRRRGLSGGRRFLCLSVATNLCVLCVFKYLNFFRESVAALLTTFGFTPHLGALDIALPLGVSFYTFQTMSYTIDVYRGFTAERSFRDFALSVACFAHLVAGPIIRAKDLMPQFKTERHFENVDLSAALYRLFRGLFKKMVVADTLAVYVDAVFSAPGDYPGFSAWIALYAYAFQIYMDFSGYTDVALAVANLFGLKFAENFDRPYLAVGPSDFWRRWHMSLSTWLRDYLYISLGGSRGGRLRTIRNLFITMALGGLWHGAAWTFVAWGVYHGVLLAVEQLLRGRRASTDRQEQPASYRALRIILMFHLTCFGWLLFRAPNWETVGVMVGRLLDFSGGEVRGLRVLLIVLACWIAQLQPIWKDMQGRFARLPSFGQGALAAVCMWTLLLLSPNARPFIYFQF